jgi:mannosyl-3-phosphoglycerate phosphatase
MRKLLFTDLDGSLLDHHDYSFSAALPALEKLKQNNVPCILTSSKTFSEIIDLREKLGNSCPFIVENGAGIFWPSGSVEEHDLPDSSVLENYGNSFQFVSMNRVPLRQMIELAQSLREKFGFKFIGFSEMSSQEVVDCTGLALDQAVKAKQRNFSEPLLWQDTEANLIQFKAFFESHDLQVIKGGRFVHLMGRSNKGKALKFIESYFQKHWQQEINTIALGDGENDVPLLEASDYAVVIKSPANKPPKIKHKHKVLTKDYGPVGWNKAVIKWLSETV